MGEWTHYGYHSIMAQANQMLAEHERLRLPAEYEDLLVRIQRDFGLEDWYICQSYAEEEALEKLRIGCATMVAAIDIVYERKWAKIWWDRSRAHDPRYDPAEILEHELAHILINPYCRACFTGEPLEHAQVIHISRACQMLRTRPEEFAVDDPQNVRAIITKAYLLTRLDENNWQIRPQERSPIYVDGRRVCAWAESLFHENHIGWGAVSARQIDLWLDYPRIQAGRGSAADDILTALWRVVLNPYGGPETSNVTEATLKRIMRVMKAYGWNQNGRGCSGECEHCGEHHDGDKG